MAKRVTTIPATVNSFNAAPVAEIRKKRVAGYARVSTDLEEQQSSYINQVSYYTALINGCSDWELAGIYTDEGISATSTKNREGFNRMIEDALDGKIDLIITKSVSRFARNTVDSLTTVRKLKEKGVEVFFEKENIRTLDAKGELLITIMSSLAQEESRSISENTKWGKRKSFADGKASVAYSKFLGYDADFAINEKEADVVRLIYKYFLLGYTYRAIGEELESRNIKPPAGGAQWYAATIRSILLNEKYKGDALLQKQYTVDFLSKVVKKNRGEIPQYYVEGHHEAIIDAHTFDLVQTEIKRRCKEARRSTGNNPFASKIMCADCGGWYGPKTWHSNSKYKHIVYQCNRKYKNKVRCTTPAIREEVIKETFQKVLAGLTGAKEETVENLLLLKQAAGNVENLQKEKELLAEEIPRLESSLRQSISENARMSLAQSDYDQKYTTVNTRYRTAINRMMEVDRLIRDHRGRAAEIDSFLDIFRNLTDPQLNFDEVLWRSLIDHITVFSDGKLVFTFRGGLETSIELPNSRKKYGYTT